MDVGRVKPSRRKLNCEAWLKHAERMGKTRLNDRQFTGLHQHLNQFAGLNVLREQFQFSPHDIYMFHLGMMKVISPHAAHYQLKPRNVMDRHFGIMELCQLALRQQQSLEFWYSWPAA